MFGSSVIGRGLEWRSTGDKPASWAYFLQGEMVAEFSRSSEDREVQAEAEAQVWRIPFHGTFVLRTGVFHPSAGAPSLVFAGSVKRGLARHQNGLGFTLYSGLTRGIGPWVGIDDERGNGVLRVRGRIGGGGFWHSVQVTPDPTYTVFVDPLLVLLGGLQVLRHTNRWLSLTTLFVSEDSIQWEIERLSAAQGFG